MNGQMQEMISKGGRATVLQMVRNRNNLEENKLQKRLMELNKELILILFQLEQEKLNTYDFLKELKCCDSDQMTEFESINRQLQENPPSPGLFLASSRGTGLDKIGTAVLQPATRTRLYALGDEGRTLDPRQVKSSPAGGFGRENSTLASNKSIRSVKEDIKERMEALLREKNQLMWHLEKLDNIPNRTVPPLPPERGGPPQPVLDPNATEYEKREHQRALMKADTVGPVSLEASIELERQKVASQSLLRIGRSKTEGALSLDKLKSASDPKRAKSGAFSGRESRQFESPSHTKVALPQESTKRPSTLTLTKPAFEVSRRESEDPFKADDSQVKLPRMSLMQQLVKRRMTLFPTGEEETHSQVRKKEVRKKLMDLGYVKEKKRQISDEDFMRKFLDRKSKGMAKRSQKQEPLKERLSGFLDKLTLMGDVKPQKGVGDMIFNLPPLAV